MKITGYLIGGLCLLAALVNLIVGPIALAYGDYLGIVNLILAPIVGYIGGTTLSLARDY